MATPISPPLQDALDLLDAALQSHDTAIRQRILTSAPQTLAPDVITAIHLLGAFVELQEYYSESEYQERGFPFPRHDVPFIRALQDLLSQHPDWEKARIHVRAWQIGEILFSPYLDWWDAESRESSPHSWFDGEALAILTAHLPTLMVLLPAQDATMHLLDFSFTEFLSEAVLDSPDALINVESETAHKATQLEVIQEIAALFLARDSQSPIGNELMFLFHTRSESGDRAAAKRYLGRLPGTASEIVLYDLISEAIIQDRDHQLALKTWKQISQGRDMERHLYTHLKGKFDANSQEALLEFYEFYCEQHPESIYLQTCLANYLPTEEARRQRLLKVLYQLPEDHFFEINLQDQYTIQYLLDLSRSYEYYAYEDHLNASLPLRPDATYGAKLMGFVEKLRGYAFSEEQLRPWIQQIKGLQ